MNTSLIAALKVYWQQVLTPQGRVLSILQLGLMSARLLLPARPLPGWSSAGASNAFGFSSAKMEIALLVAFFVQWCAWSEVLYSLRLTSQPSDTTQGSGWRRFALHIYGGFVFLFVLNALVTVQPLLGIGAMFLLFMSAEAQEKAFALKPIPVALLGGMGRSYRLISHEPWRFLASLLLPGMVLYAGGLLLVWMRLLQVPWILRGAMLVLWLGFFFLAQLRVALRAEGELDVDVLMGKESQAPPHPSRQAIEELKVLLSRFNPLCNALATVLGLAIGAWLLYQLGSTGLLSSQAPAMAFSTMVGLLSSTVSAFLSLLVKVGFIAVVVGGIVVVLMLTIGFGRREPLKPLQSAAGRLERAFERFAGSFNHLHLTQSATLGLGTLLTALGTVAVQTYDQVQKDQARQTIVRETLQRRQIKEEENAQARLLRNDQLVARIRQRVMELRTLEGGSNHEQLRKQSLDQLLSELRDVLPELKLANGAVDGERKGKLLRYLYESGLLHPNLDGQPFLDACIKPISLTQRGEPAKDVQGTLERNGCKPDLFLHAMDFSGAMLKNAYLTNVFLPFLNLKNADLSGARLKGATLRFAKLDNADLTGADITGTDLAQSTLTGANLTNAAWAAGNEPDIRGAVAFYAVYQAQTQEDRDKEMEKGLGVISWDLVKGPRPSPVTTQAFWTFCPLDPQSSRLAQGAKNPRMSQGGSKCRNRRFDPRETDNNISGRLIDSQSTEFVNRDWSGSSFSQSTLKGMTFENINLAGADLAGATFENMTIKDVSFVGANLQGTTFRESELENVNFTGANLKGLRLEKVRRISNTNFRGVLIDLESNKSFSSYGKDLIRHQVYDSSLFVKESADVVSAFRRNFFAPLLITPWPLRPQQLLYWMLAYPLPGTSVSWEWQP